MRLLYLVPFLLLSSPAFAQGQSVQSVLDATVNRVVRPAVAEFKREAAGLEIALVALCAGPSAETVDIARDRFERAALSFAHVEFITLGPLSAENRRERLIGWQGVSGLGAAETILQSRDAGAATVAGLRDRDPAAQGLPALELVLFGAGADSLAGPSGQFRCSYGRAVAINISEMASALALGWYSYDGVDQQLTRPERDSADRPGNVAALNLVLEMIGAGLDEIDSRRLVPLVGDKQREEALFWQSGLAWPMVGAELKGLERLLVDTGASSLLYPPQADGEDRIEGSLAAIFALLHEDAGVSADGVRAAVQDLRDLMSAAPPVAESGAP